MLVWLATLVVATTLALSVLRKYLSPHSHKPSNQTQSLAHEKKSVTKMHLDSDVTDLSSPKSDEQAEADATPKALPATTNSTPIPVFNLDEPAHADSSGIKSVAPPPAPPSAQKTTPSQPRPPVPTLKPPSTPSLMPPPRGPSTLGPPATPASNGLRLPSTGPLPNRGPPTSTGLAPSANTAGKRNKIQLKPGHSPLDWATLTRSGKNLAGVPGLQRVTPSMLKFHHGRKGRDAWASYRGKVYNISPYLPFHPGGEGELMRAAGKDGEKLFMEYHPWVNWDNMLGSCLVGIMVSEGSGEGLDDLD